MGNLGPAPFRYNSIWNDGEEAKKITTNVWVNQTIGSPSYAWESKIKYLRKELKQWANNSQVETQNRKIEIIIIINRQNSRGKGTTRGDKGQSMVGKASILGKVQTKHNGRRGVETKIAKSLA